MQRKEIGCATPKCTKTTNTTAGILTGLAVSAATIGGTIVASNSGVQTCQLASSTLDSFISGFLNRTVSVPSFSISFSTNFPSEVPASAVISTPFGSFPINTNVTLDMPKDLAATVGPFIAQIEDLVRYLFGQTTVDYLHAFPQSAGDTCNEYVHYVVIIMGAALTFFMLLQVATTFGFGSKICEHEERIEELEEESIQRPDPKLEEVSVIPEKSLVI